MRLLNVLFFLIITINVYGQELSESDVQKLHQDIENIYVAFENGDASIILANTHPSIYTLVGSKEAFGEMMQNAVKQLNEAGVKFLSSELDAPTRLYVAGDEELCFVPRVYVMEIRGTKIQSVGFMIAARKIGSDEWKYLDGSGLREDQDMLWQFFPALDRGVELPPNYVTQVQ